MRRASTLDRARSTERGRLIRLERPRPADANGPFGRRNDAHSCGRCDLLATPHRLGGRARGFGVSLDKAILMAPGSTTHHSDLCQRYHQLAVAHLADNRLKFALAASDKELPSGYYMLFVQTNTGIVAPAVWIKVLPP